MIKTIRNRSVENIVITTATPVFVGSGDTLNATQYIYLPEDNLMLIPHERDWIRFLRENNLMERYENYVRNYGLANQQGRNRSSGGAPKLAEWLKGERISKNKMAAIPGRHVKAAQIHREKAADLHLCVKNAFAQPYLPGSSLKGAIRSAVLFHQIREKEQVRKTIWNDLMRETSNGEFMRINRGKWMGISQQMEMKLMEIPGTRMRPTDDPFRGLQISDTMPFVSDTCLEVVQKADWSLLKESISYLTVFRESITPGVSTNFQVVMDHGILGSLVPSPDELDKMLKGYADFVKTLMEKHFKAGMDHPTQEYHQANLVLGAGSGFYAKSLLYALAPDPESARKFISGLLENSFRMHKHQRLDRSFSPRTLKLGKTEGKHLPLGWCHLEFERKRP